MCQLSKPPRQHLSNHTQLETSTSHNKFIEQNNQKALELLMRIQSQIEASTVIATSHVKASNYE